MSCVLFSPQGDRLVLAGTKYTEDDDPPRQSCVSVWQLPPGTGQPKEEGSLSLGRPDEFSLNTDVRAAAFSADGRRLALVTRWSVSLWEWQPQRKQLAVLTTHLTEFAGMALSSDGSEVVTAGMTRVEQPDTNWLSGLQFWGFKDGRLKGQGAHMDGQNHVEQVAFALGGKALLMGSAWGEYALIDRAKQHKLWHWQPPGRGYLPFTMAPDERHVALCNVNGTVYIVRLKEVGKP